MPTRRTRPLPSTDDEIEIGWHLARKAWGHGYASEAGTAVLRCGFSDLGLGRICALVNPQNIRSAAVARRIGLQWMETTNRYYDGDREGPGHGSTPAFPNQAPPPKSWGADP